MSKLGFAKHTIRTIIITILVSYFGLITLLSIPAIQRKSTAIIQDELSELLNTEVSIGNIDLGLLNRIIIQNVHLKDQQGNEMLTVARFSAKFDIQPLLRGKISISSIQLFGMNARLNKANPKSPANFQFVIDAFKSDDKEKKDFNLDLRINSLLIKRGNVRYDVLSEEVKPERFDYNHIGIENISAKLSLKALNKDSLNVQIRRMSLNERSGFQLKRLTGKVIANRKSFSFKDFFMSLPHSDIAVDTFSIQNPVNVGLGILDKRSSYSGELNGSVALSDFNVFAPQLKAFNENINLNISAHGTGEKHTINSINLYNNSGDINLIASGYIKRSENSKYPYLNGKISRALISGKGLKLVTENLSGNEGVPPIITRLGFVDFKGEIKGKSNNLSTIGIFNISPGTITANVTLKKDSVSMHNSLSGRVSTDGLNLGELTGDEQKMGNTIFNLEFKGFKYNNEKPETYIKGLVSELEYNHYVYQNIQLDGEYKRGGFKGEISMNDTNGNISITGNFNTKDRTPFFNVNTRIEGFRPYDLKLTKTHKGSELSLNMKADFKGNSIDDIEGEIRIDSLCISNNEDAEKNYFLKSFSIKAGNMDMKKNIAIESPFLKGEIEGEYSYKTIWKSIQNVIAKHIPSIMRVETTERKKACNNFRFDIRMDNAEILSKVFNVPFKLNMPATLKGYFDDDRTRLYINGNLPQITYDEKQYESVSFIAENSHEAMNLKFRVNAMMDKGAMVNLSLLTNAYNDTLVSTVYWGNNTNVTYSGKLNALTHFYKEIDNSIASTIDITPSKVILNDTIWNVHPTRVSLNKDSINIDNFLFEHSDQHIRINGKIGKSIDDICKVDLKNINIQYIMNMIQFHAVEFDGSASGEVIMSNLMEKPQINALLDVDRFTLNNALLGRALIKGDFDNDMGAIMLDADIKEEDDLYTKVKGYVSPKMKGLDLDIEAGGTNLAFLEYFIDNIFSDIKGRAYGKVRLYGPFKELDLEGDAKADMSMKVNVLNTRFNLNTTDSVKIRSGLFQFNNVAMTDVDGNKGIANGELKHHKLGQLKYQFRFDTERLMIYNTTTETPDFPFYGKLYTTGNVVLRGGGNSLNVDGTLRADNKTQFAYVLGTASAATDNQFITFVDKTPRRIQEKIKPDLYHYLNTPRKDEEDDTPLDIYINLEIEPTEQATMKVIMDPIAGDNITAKGTGNLRINFYNKGDFQMFGNYNVAEGVYKMSMQNIIRKDFILQPGGTVSFNGNPKEANMDMQAVYTVSSASLNDLIPDASNSKGNVRVNCLLNLTGNINSPNLKFDLELPTVSDEDKELVRSLTSTEDQMNTQIIYLLGIGKFYPFNYANNSNQSDATSSLAFSTLSGQLNNILSQVIDSQNWNIGTSLTTGEKGWSDVEAEAILSGRLLNNRLIINGNFGYRENTMTNTNFVGDFEAIWLLTKNGEFRLRGYNQTNDRYFTKSTLTTQGVGLMYKKDFSYWKELINWMLRKKKDKKEKKE